MEERKENQQENREVRPLARLLARELTTDEVAQISAACGGCAPTGEGANQVPDAIL